MERPGKRPLAENPDTKKIAENHYMNESVFCYSTDAF